MSETVVENLRSAVYASYEELSAQVQADSALDAKLLGLLGFFAAAASLLLTLPDGLYHQRGFLLAGLILGILACLAGSMASAAAKAGPPPEQFYADYGAREETGYLAQLLADLASTARRNHQGLELRRRALVAAVCMPILLAALYGLSSVI